MYQAELQGRIDWDADYTYRSALGYVLTKDP